MALIKCTECGKEISDKAIACPHCGCPMDEILRAMKNDNGDMSDRETAEIEADDKTGNTGNVEKNGAAGRIGNENENMDAEGAEGSVNVGEGIGDHKKSAPLSPEEKKKVAIISCIGIAIVFGAAFVAWYFTIKVPRDEAYAKFITTQDTYNLAVEDYNDAVMAYNDKANRIMEVNDEFTAAITEAQDLIDCGDTPYDTETMTVLSTTLKNARNSICDTPTIYEKEETIALEGNYKNSFAGEINEAADQISSAVSGVETNTKTITDLGNDLAIPDYSEEIAEIGEEEKALEESYAIQKQITNPTQDFVISRLNNVKSIANIACVTEDNDPNGKLGKDGGYTAQIYFSSPLLGTESLAGDNLIEGGTDAGGSIEIYKTVAEAENRNTYLATFDGSIFDSGKHIVVGTMLVRVSTELTATQQNNFTDEIIAELTALTEE